MRALQARGISVLSSSILFMEHHTRDGLARDVDWAIAHGSDMHQFMQLTPLPGTPLFERYRIAMRQFQGWLAVWFGPAWSIQSFERCVAIAFVFPVALFLLASLLYGYKSGQVGNLGLGLFFAAAIGLSLMVRWLFHTVYWSAQRAWAGIAKSPKD